MIKEPKPKPPVEKMIEVRSLYFEDYPEMVYFLPCGTPGCKIVVREDPYVGVSFEVVREEKTDENKWVDYV